MRMMKVPSPDVLSGFEIATVQYIANFNPLHDRLCIMCFMNLNACMSCTDFLSELFDKKVVN